MGKKRSRDQSESVEDMVDKELEAEMRAVEEIRAEREKQTMPEKEIRYNKEVEEISHVSVNYQSRVC